MTAMRMSIGTWRGGSYRVSEKFTIKILIPY